LDCQLLEDVKFSGIEHRNLADLVSIVVSLKNKYGIGPHAAGANGYLIRNALTVNCLNGIHHAKQVIDTLLDIPRLHGFTMVPRGNQNRPIQRRHHTWRLVPHQPSQSHLLQRHEGPPAASNLSPKM
jgi:hypothetical protein